MPYYAQRAATVSPRGPWEADHWYEIGDLATLNGSMWYAASRNINDPPPSRAWWGPFLLGGIPGLGGGHIIQDTYDNEVPARTYLKFDYTSWEEGDNEWLTVTDNAGADQTVVTYDTEPITPETLQDTIGRGYDFTELPLNLANFAHPAHPAPPAQMGVDNFGIAHFRGAVTAVQPGNLLMCTLPTGLLPYGRASVRLPVWVDSATPHEPPFIRIQGNGEVYMVIADAGDVVHLDGVRYVAGLGGRRIARDNEFFTPEEPEAFSVGSSFTTWWGSTLRRCTGYGVVNAKRGRDPWYVEETYGINLDNAVGFPAFVRNYKTHPECGGWSIGPDLDKQYIGWEVVEGPDEGMSFPPEPISYGWGPHYNQVDFPWPEMGMEQFNPAFYVSDQVIVPPPYPYTSVDAQVWVYLRNAPLTPGNVIRVYLDMVVQWGAGRNDYIVREHDSDEDAS